MSRPALFVAMTVVALASASVITFDHGAREFEATKASAENQLIAIKARLAPAVEGVGAHASVDDPLPEGTGAAHGSAVPRGPSGVGDDDMGGRDAGR